MDTGTIILLCVGVVLLGGMFVFNYFASKKQRQAESDRLKSLKVGDKVMMTCGIQGTITEINEISPVDTMVVIRTGSDDAPSTLTFDIRAVYRTMNEITAQQPAEEEENAAAVPAEQNTAAASAEDNQNTAVTADEENTAEKK